jgi:hypothetical protein
MLAALQSAQQALEQSCSTAFVPSAAGPYSMTVDRIQSVSFADTPTLLNKLG